MKLKNRSLRLVLLIGTLLTAGAAGIVLYTSYHKTIVDSAITNYEPARDRQFLLDLFKKNFYWLVADEHYNAEYMLDNRASMQYGPAGDLTIKVYLVDNKPIGFVAYHKLSFYKGRVLFLAVDEAHRKKGYAEKLLRYALKALKDDGSAIIQISTRTDNIRAQSLYRKISGKEVWRDESFVRFEVQA